MSRAGGDEWVRPFDPMEDSDAPEQIAHELERRYALYLREARSLAAARQVPDEAGLADGIRGETRRYLDSHPCHAQPALAPAVEAAEKAALASLHDIAAGTRSAAAPAAPVPVRRLALQPSPTYVGTVPLRKRRTGDGIALEWSREPGVVEWVVRVSTRPDPRADYMEQESVTLAAGATSFELALDDVPRRVQLLGQARGGRVVQRATVSALTRGNSGAQWKRQAGGG
jgi:hypothetical protein